MVGAGFPVGWQFRTSCSPCVTVVVAGSVTVGAAGRGGKGGRGEGGEWRGEGVMDESTT